MLYLLLINFFISIICANNSSTIITKNITNTKPAVTSSNQSHHLEESETNFHANKNKLIKQYSVKTNQTNSTNLDVEHIKIFSNVTTIQPYNSTFDRVIISINNVTKLKFDEVKSECCEHEKYIVSLRRANPLTSDLFAHVCIAVLLTRDIVICPAHCFYDKRGRFIDNPDFYRVVVGKSVRSSFTPGIIVTNIVQHPEYLPYIRRNDIALVRLSYQMPGVFKPMINHLNYKDVTSRDNCTQIFFTSAVSGNDALQEGYKLVVLKVNIMHWLLCMKLYEKWGILISQNQLCSTKHDSCIADDGSVLICNNELTGILSFRNDERGFKFYSDILPDVFTATSRYQFFLRTQISQMNNGAKMIFNKIPVIILISMLSAYFSRMIIYYIYTIII